jgi:DNA modification methylase
MKIETTPIEKLIPYARNSRTHSDQQVAQVAASIREFGFTNPVLIDSEDGIIAGHGRVMAARKLGLTEVPCIRLGHLTETQKRAYIIADNKLALNSGWDEEMLGLELADLREADFDLDLVGFDAGEIEAALNPAEITDGLTDPDEVPEPPADPVTVLGDVWVLGNHRLMCGDSTSIDAVEKLMDGGKADMVFTDPPYGIGFKYNSHQDTTGDEYMDFCRDWFHVIRQKSEFIVISTGWAYNAFWYSYNPKDCFYWICKNKRTGGSISHFRKVEPLFIWGKPDKKYNFDFFEQTTEIEKELQGKHTCPKPVSLILSIIDGGKTNGVILDVFGGSGTTIIACEKTNRHARLMELDPKYCDVIINRWQDFTGKKAIHESSGKTFDEMKAAKP